MTSKKQPQEITWGIIGAGDVCEIKSAPAMQLIPHSSLQIVMRRDPAKAQDYATRHKVPEWTTDAAEVLNHPKVNAIYIATPPAHHASYTLEAAEVGKPVYVEKPMARTYQECLQMINACKQADVSLFTAYYRRALPHFLKIKELLEARVIGDVRFVKIELFQSINEEIEKGNIDWRVDPSIAGGGYFYDLASHQFDLLDFLLGPVSSGKGYAKNQAGKYKAEDIVTGTFEFDSGALGTGTWCFTVAPSDSRDVVIIYGTEGHIAFTTFGSSDVTLFKNGSSKTFQFKMPRHIQHPLIQQVVDDLRGAGTCVSTGESGARANRVMSWLSGSDES